MVTRNDLERWLNEYLSVHTVKDFLPNGLQIEGKERIERVALAVSINMEVIEEAVSFGADALIVHHGMFWKNDDPRLTSYRKERLKRILEGEINLFAYHLPLDLHPLISHNRRILEGVACDRIVDVDEYFSSLRGMAQPPPDASRIGLVGMYEKPLSFSDLVSRVESFLGGPVGFFDHGKTGIRSVYVVSGGGRNEIDGTIPLGVDVFITGDAKESTPYVTRESGINYIYGGHYLTERPGLLALAGVLEESLPVATRFIEIVNPL
jgi:dinuclear metal center YbgI/SA1388 family protein